MGQDRIEQNTKALRHALADEMTRAIAESLRRAGYDKPLSSLRVMNSGEDGKMYFDPDTRAPVLEIQAPTTCKSRAEPMCVA